MSQLVELKQKAAGISVLYVEDDQTVRQVLGKMLRKIFDKVDDASNGQEGLDLFNKSIVPYDLVISDISMPIMNGIDMIDQIKQKEPSQYTVITSAHGDSEYLMKAVSLGVDSFLIKPVDVNQLINCLQKVVDRLNKDQEIKRVRTLYTDELTKLPTRLKMLQDSKLGTQDVIILNVDDFHRINEAYGYKFGDKVLQEIANRLYAVANACQATAYRVHGDLFALLIPSGKTKADLQKIADDIQLSVQYKAFSCDQVATYLVVTIGILLASEMFEDREHYNIEAMELAGGSLLRKAKETKKDIIFYQRDLNSFQLDSKSSIDTYETILTALEKDRFTLYLQPIVQNDDGAVKKYECLVRLIKEGGETMHPGQFLSIAESTKTYPAISRIVLKNGLDLLKKHEIAISINLSVSDIVNDDMREFIIDAVAKHAEIGNRLTFEILESDGISNYQQVEQFIKQVKQYGVQIAIDDFGVGYSNYKHITELDIDYVKIDGSLIKNLPQDSKSLAIVESIQLLCNRLGIKTVAEFVHSEEVLQAVSRLGINYSQGFFLGKPTPWE